MKRKIFIVLALLVAIVLAFASCGKPDPEVSALNVVEGTLKLEYEVGEKPDFSGVEAVVTFDNGEALKVTAKDLSFGKLDTSTEGEKELEIKYGDFAIKVKVTVKPATSRITLDYINIVESTVEKVVRVGSEYDISGLQVEAKYSNGSVEIIPVSELQITLPSTAEAGKKNLVVSYGEKSDSVEVTVIGVTAIEILNNSLAAEVFVGGAVNTTGVEVLATFSDGSKQIVNYSELTFGNIDTTAIGEATLTVTYLDYTYNHKVNVVGITDLVVSNVATSVKVNGTLDVSGITALAKYSNGSEKPVTTAQLTVVNIDTSAVGVKQLKVSYEGFEKTVDITVVGVKSIQVLSGVKSEVLVGEAFSTDGIQVQVTYTDENETVETLGASALTLGSVDTATVGEKQLSIAYLDGSTNYTVKVCGPTGLKVTGVQPTYSIFVGDTVNIANLKVYVVYGDTAKTEFDVTAVATNNFASLDFSVAGEKTLTISYNGTHGDFTTEVRIECKTPLLTGLTVKTNNNLVGHHQSYNKSNITATAIYENGKTVPLTAADLVIGDVDTTTVGVKTIAVSYTDGGVTKSADISIEVKAAKGIRVSGVPLFVLTGNNLDLTNMKVFIVHYDNTETELTTGWTDNRNDLDFDTVGEDRQLVVSYAGIYGAFTHTVTIANEQPPLDRIEMYNYVGEILVGRTYDVSAIKVRAIYTTGYSVIIDSTDLDIETINTSTAGVYNITVSYPEGGNTKSTSFELKVCGVTEFRVTGVQPTYSIFVGETINIANLKVYAVYGDTAATEFDVTAEATNNFASLDFSVAGEKTLTVSYNGTHGNFALDVATITVKTPSLVGITILTADRIIGVGQTYNKNSITVKATYDNGDEKTVKASELSIPDISGGAGNASVTVSYTDGGIDKDAELTVKILPVASISVSGLADKLDVGAELDTSALVLAVTYSDGTDTITGTVGMNSDVIITGFDKNTVGNQTVTVSYLGATATKNIVVRGVSSIRILAGQLPAYVRFGYAIDYSAVQLEITYSDGTVEYKTVASLGSAISISTQDNQRTIVIGYDNENKPITATQYYRVSTVTYTTANGSFTASGESEILRVQSVNALNGSVPSSVLLGSMFSANGFKLTVIYVDANGKTYTYAIGAEDSNLEINISDVDTSTAGEKAVKFKFTAGGENHETNVIVTVKGVKALSIVPGSMATTVNKGKELDTTNLVIRAEFTDETYAYITRDQLVVGSIDTSAPGKVQLSITYREKTENFDIQVIEAVTGGMIYGVALPDNLTGRDTYKEGFKVKDEAYVVGDDNPYYFYLDLLKLDADKKIVDVDGKNTPSKVKVYLLDNGTFREITGDELNSYVIVNAAANSYDFVDGVATGKTFRLEITPDALVADSSACTRTHEVTVVDAYNVYEAWELNFITNAQDDVDTGALSIVTDLQHTVVENYLKNEHGVENPAAIVNSINGIVLHGNLSVKPSDLPPEYFEQRDSSQDPTGSKGLFYDFLMVYNRKIAKGQTFSMYGNYYTLYTYELPCIVKNGHPTRQDDISSHTKMFRFRGMTDHEYWNVMTGKGIEFNHQDYKAVVSNMAFRDNDPNSNDQTASERHIRGSGCFSPMWCDFTVYNSNVHAYYISMVPENDDLTINLDSVDFYNAWQGHIFIWNANTTWSGSIGDYTKHNSEYSVHATHHSNYQPIKINIKDSRLAKCGGPVILSQTDRTHTDGRTKHCAPEVVAIDSELYSYVTGQEAWFVAVGQTAIAGQILAMDQLVSGTAQGLDSMFEQMDIPMDVKGSYLSNKKIAGVNTMNMIMVNMGVGIDLSGSGYECKFTSIKTDGNGNEISRTVGLYMDNEAPAGSSAATVNQYVGATGAPVFQSSAGGTCYADPYTPGHQGVFDLNAGNAYGGYADPSCFEGEYISLYVYGLGIMFEYYHE